MRTFLATASVVLLILGNLIGFGVQAAAEEWALAIIHLTTCLTVFSWVMFGEDR